MHLFIRELGKKFYSESMSSTIGVTAENKEKYISFNVDVVVGFYEVMWVGLTKKNSA